MASIARDKGGRKRLLFFDKNRKRRTIRLGKMTQKQADAVKIKVEALVAAQLTGALDDETARWVASLADLMRGKLEKAGLIVAHGKTQCPRLAEWLAKYVEGRADVKPATATVYGHTRRNLLAYFGGDKPLDAITPGDADGFRIHLATVEKLADNTVRRRMGIASQFFRAALRRKIIGENPFTGQTTAVQSNPKRQYFVSREEAEAVLEAMPSAAWRLAFALARYGGLRPSEIVRLTWGDVNWQRSRFTVHAVKTEHHASAGVRVLPIFPELHPYLMEAFQLTEPGAVYCCPQYENANQMYRKVFMQAIKRAGLKPWPKLFVNLRASRATELAEHWPAHVACSWLGHSPAVAARHYLQVTDEHFKIAAQVGAKSGAATSALARTEPQGAEGVKGAGEHFSNNCEHLRDGAAKCGNFNDLQVGDIGLEPMTLRV